MEPKTKILGRSSIHRDESPVQHRDSQDRFSESYESNDENDTYNSQHVSIEAGELKKRIHSKSKQNRKELKIELENSTASEFAGHDEPVGFLEQHSSFNFKMILVIILMCLFLFYVYFVSTQPPHTIQNIHVQQKKNCSFDELKKKYPKEDDAIWNHLKYGNEDILNNESDKPAVFLFVHHTLQDHIVEKIIEDIAQTSSRCFGESSFVQKMDLTAIDATHDYGHIIETYKKQISEGHVVLIGNLNEINGEAAKALHAICDTITPLVKKVVILLSLTAHHSYEGEKDINMAENALRKLWEKYIKPYELEPIIARVTDQVLRLKSDPFHFH